jgi:hypothetical protein
MCASRLSIRRAGPDRRDVKKTSRGRESFGNAYLDNGRLPGPGTLVPMGGWYWIGVSVGLGAGAGVLVAGVAARVVAAALLVAAAAGAGLGFAIDSWQPGGWGDVAAGAAGGIAGALGAAQIVRGALRRGGTSGGTAALVAGAAVVAAGLAWIPAVGYLEALALPALAARLRRREPERYAGLRTLAK